MKPTIETNDAAYDVDDIMQLEKENTRLKARVARLEDIVRLARSSHNRILTSNPPKDAWIYNNVDSKISSILNESDQQSLVEIQADYLQSILTKYDCGAMEYVLRQELE